MSDMIAVAYPDIDTATRALAELRALNAEHTVRLADVMLLTRDEEGKVKIQGESHPATAGAIGGAFWGSLIGLLLLQPLLGAAVGAAAGGLGGAVTGESDEVQFVKQLGRHLASGHAAVVAVITDATVDKAVPRMARHGGEVLHTSLSQYDQLNLSHALSGRPMTVQ
jgi:uncharacterized membrane protein